MLISATVCSVSLMSWIVESFDNEASVLVENRVGGLDLVEENRETIDANIGRTRGK